MELAHDPVEEEFGGVLAPGEMSPFLLAVLDTVFPRPCCRESLLFSGGTHQKRN